MSTVTYVIVGLIVAAVLFVTAAIGIDARRRPARERNDELEFTRLRPLAEGVDVHDCNAHEPYGPAGTVYTSSAVTAVEVVPIEPPADAWMVKVVVDPTLSELDVVTAVEHVAPGVGSMTSFAATVEDTRMRTSAEVRELEAAEAAAYAMAPAENDRLFFAAFNTAIEAAFTDFAVGTRAVRRWENQFHGDVHYANCGHCAEVHHVHSDEYQQIVSDRVGTDTGAWSVITIAV